jgi:hypothetical protein
MMRHSAANGRGRGNSDSRISPPGRRLNTLEQPIKYERDILYVLVNSSTFASQAKINIFASQMTRISHKKCTRFD